MWCRLRLRQNTKFFRTYMKRFMQRNSVKWWSPSILPRMWMSYWFWICKWEQLWVNVTSPNQHSGNQNNENRIILVSSLPNFWARYSQNTIEQPNKVKLHVLYIKLNFFQSQQLKNQNKSSCYYSSVFLLNFGQAPNT